MRLAALIYFGSIATYLVASWAAPSAYWVFMGFLCGMGMCTGLEMSDAASRARAYRDATGEGK